MIDVESEAYEFSIDRMQGVKNALSGLGYCVNEIPLEVIEAMEAAQVRSRSFQEVDMSLMPQLLLETLLPFQRIGVEFAIQRGGKALICDDMGLGKTIQGIAVASYYMSEWPVLILAQSSLKRVWSAEFERWLPGVRNHIRVVESANDFKVSQITIMAYDLAGSMAETLQKHNFKVIVADESHMLKSPTAARTKALLPVLRHAKRTILLSGTPALSRPCELFPQLLALDASVWPTMHGFGLRYCNAHEGPFGWDYKGNSNLVELNALLTNTVMIRRLKHAVLSDLPPKVRKIVEIEKDSSLSMDPIDSNDSFNQTIQNRLEMLSEQEDMMNESIIDEEMETKSKTKNVKKPSKTQLPPKSPFGDNDNDDILSMYRDASVAKQQGVRTYIRKLVQEENAASFKSSFAPFGPDQVDVSEWHTSQKTQLKPIGRKFLVFAHHLPMLDVVESELKALHVPCIRIDGGTSTKDRANYVKQFQEQEYIRAAVLSITCASTGLTLTSSSLVIFAELYWNPGMLVQAEDRVHRLGQTAPFVELRYLFCKGTADDVMWPLIGKKLGVVGSALNGAKDKLALNGSPTKKSKITSIIKKKDPKKMPEVLDLIEDPPNTIKAKEQKKNIKQYFSPSGPHIHSVKTPLMETIVIDDSQESITLVYRGTEKKRTLGLEDLEDFIPSPKRRLESSPSTPVKQVEEEEEEEEHQLDQSVLGTPTPNTPTLVTTPWSRTKLSFISPNGVRLGLNKY
jgi:SWI/SNF-related matrix-associated actin-dependent regulator 1 of chromatin subfamily A